MLDCPLETPRDRPFKLPSLRRCALSHRRPNPPHSVPQDEGGHNQLEPKTPRVHKASSNWMCHVSRDCSIYIYTFIHGYMCTTRYNIMCIYYIYTYIYIYIYIHIYNIYLIEFIYLITACIYLFIIYLIIYYLFIQFYLFIHLFIYLYYTFNTVIQLSNDFICVSVESEQPMSSLTSAYMCLQRNRSSLSSYKFGESKVQQSCSAPSKRWQNKTPPRSSAFTTDGHYTNDFRRTFLPEYSGWWWL